MKTKIEELEPGDLIYVQYGFDLEKAKYLGNGAFRLTGVLFGIGDIDLASRWWSYRRRSLWKFIKDLIKNYENKKMV